MKKFKETIYEIIESDGNTLASKIYDWIMLLFIVASIVPLMFRTTNPTFDKMEVVAVCAFVVDYLLRWWTADLRLKKDKRWKSFLLYPFTPFAIVDLLSILPIVTLFHRSLRLFRIPRLLKILRVFKFIRYSRNMQVLLRVLHKERHLLFAVFLLAVTYIVMTALIMFNMEESEMFEDFFDALYWATTTLTTVGYGDICPLSDIGRVVSMFSAIMGVAIIALPSGVITASYLDELREARVWKENVENTENKSANAPKESAE